MKVDDRWRYIGANLSHHFNFNRLSGGKSWWHKSHCDLIGGGNGDHSIVSPKRGSIKSNCALFLFFFLAAWGSKLLNTPKCALNSPKMESIKDNFPISAAGGSLREGSDDGSGVEIYIPFFSLHFYTLFLFWSRFKVGSKLNPESKTALKSGYAKSSSLRS